MESNATEFQRTISSMRIFGSTNHKLFKRYKHGGMTIICDPPLDRNEDFLKKFETFNAVIMRNDPLKDLIMIPFSEKVKESYQILIHGLQKIINEIVSNRISCIQRRVPGIIPLLRYNVTLPIDKGVVEEGIANFYETHPAIPIITDLKLSADLKKESIEFYDNIEVFLEECRKRKEVADEYNQKNGQN